MVEDFFNGLNIVSLDADHSVLSSTKVAFDHPWRSLYGANSVHGHSTPQFVSDPPDIRPPPGQYRLIKEPPREGKYPFEQIDLYDVETFRSATAMKAGATVSPPSTASSPIRPVIYRYIDVIKSSFALLEAIHFELFVPDRSDLRFLAVPFTSIPSGTIEGDYFRVPDADLLSDLSFAVKLGNAEYPVVWEAKRIERMEFKRDESSHELGYVLQKGKEFVRVLCANSGDTVNLRITSFRNRETSLPHSLVLIRSRSTSTAIIYPVMFLKEEVSSMENEAANANPERPRKQSARVYGIRASSTRDGATSLRVEDLPKEMTERMEDRLGAFCMYGRESDGKLIKDLFSMGSRYRSHEAKSKILDDSVIDESVIYETISTDGLCSLAQCRPLLDCIYGATPQPQPDASSSADYEFCGLSLNTAQSLSVDWYVNKKGPRIFAIRSPPGSGKTTVAAVMAAEVARREGGAQLLLSVQNVAVDNMGSALMRMGFEAGEVYNLKGYVKLNADCPAPFDFFDSIDEDTREQWRRGEIPEEDSESDDERLPYPRMKKTAKGRKSLLAPKEMSSFEVALRKSKRIFESTLHPKILLSTVEMSLRVMFKSDNISAILRRVKRVIIDEASLLTEAALFSIIRRFPEARIVLIGDDKQLPPFMYDSNILGHELAGRPALTVAMKTGRVPVVELNEVYRAPPSLVAPYNRLAYGGRLVSKKGEGHYPLSDIGLIPCGRPQLLLIDVDGNEERCDRTSSYSNKMERNALIDLLTTLPSEMADKVMIISLYKEQRKRTEEYLSVKFRKEKFSVLTVDSVQGKEKPIVILMTTRTDRTTNFFCSIERCNVSISRQQQALIILGKAALLSKIEPWSTVVNGDDFTVVKFPLKSDQNS